MIPLDAVEVERFRAAILRRFGLHFDEARKDHLADVLRRRLEARGAVEGDAYLSRLESGWRDEEETLAESLTVGETYFFRYRDHFRAFKETVLSEISARDTRGINILSAGCSSGEEPYSLAIAIREASSDFAVGAVSILGVDLNPAALSRAARARYSEWSLRETPDDLRARYFAREGRDYVLDPAIVSMVAFERENLADQGASLFRPGAYDVVFCRNVTMYLAPEVVRRLVARFALSLAPGGFLFLGHAETLRGVSRDFVLCRSHDAFYYQRREGASESECVTFGAPERQLPIEASPLPPDTSWVDAIRLASDRIATLDRATRRIERRSTPPLQPSPGSADHASRLLAAVLLANDGKLVEAEDACRSLLADDDLNAGAHYVLALCREHAEDREGALEQDRMAAYLDPDFAMPHLHRGLLARRAANFDEAKVALERAIALLWREADARILLFGGGFGRQALIALCRAELRAVEAKA